jgi:D-arabinose 1-dehydrogenase-like Zn-dependent alcohol dehydrogenase
MMHALVKQKAAPGLEMIECEMPSIGENDVLIKVLRIDACVASLIKSRAEVSI